MNDVKTVKLLPCPFCGGTGTLNVDTPGTRYATPDNYYVLCDWLNGGCGASGGVRRTKAGAIAAWNSRANTVLVSGCTPEQAIAATLGNGTLTAEQVREVIEHHGIASLGCRWQFTDRSYEAIADELNAHVGRTCRLLAEGMKR